MKRALAERAKQSGLRNGLTGSNSNGPTTTTSSSSELPPGDGRTTDSPPLKIPRIAVEAPTTLAPEKAGTLISLPEEPTSVEALNQSSSSITSQEPPPPPLPPVAATNETKISIPSSAAVASSTTTTPRPVVASTPTASTLGTTTTGNATPRGGRNASASMKRQRSSTNASTEKTEETENLSAFYLKHQNRALASELKALQYQLLLLEKERDFRRKQCRSAMESLQSLDATWTQMETALQLGEAPASTPQMRAGFRSTDLDEPRSTGVGNSVELVGALLDSLAALGSPQELKPDVIQNASVGDDTTLEDLEPAEVEHLTDMQRISLGISRRAMLLQQWIWTLLQKLDLTDTAEVPPVPDSSVDTASPTILQHASLFKEISELQSQCRDYEAQIEELSKARDDLTESERKVRRGLYRLAAGRMKLDEVLKAIEESDEDGTATAAWMEGPIDTLTTAAATITTTASGPDAEPVDSAHLAQLKKQVADLEEIASCREKKIEEMLAEREDYIRRINSLCVPVKKEGDVDEKGISNEEVKQSTLYIETAAKLASTERVVEHLRAKIEETKHKWAQARGDADLALKSLRELEETSSRRLIELSGMESPETGSDLNLSAAALSESVSQAQQIVQLEHKLKQALENVRQAEFVRQSLTEALSMNELLQLKLDDLKAKYSALLNSRNAVGKTSAETLPAGSTTATVVPVTLSSTPKEKPPVSTPTAEASTSSQAPPPTADRGDRNEKLHRDYRRLRKELEATRASKDAAKAKLERAEKERDQLMQTNARLLKQSTEKDDMNAKSLSTILHLKHLTEQLAKEKENLEVQAKTAGQLALSARLTANAKERVAEEISKEKETLESSLNALRETCSMLDQEKDAVNGSVAHLKGEMHSLALDLEKAKNRCDELASESTKQEAGKQKYAEALAVAQRQAAEAVKNLANLSRQAGGAGVDGSVGTTVFTAEQLSTQVAVLKGRLACPVCNHRDKKCILMRCRHMFCKHCVEENLKNRSRKCPACGQAFGAKDVHDVWL